MTDHVSVERAVAAPPERVWDLISDVSRMGEWSPETTTCEWIKGASGPAVGARFRGTNRVGSRRWSTTCVVTEAVPARSFAFRSVVGPVPIADWSYRIDATADGCRVTESWTDRRNWLGKKLGKPVSGVADRAEHNRRTMATTLDHLAAAAEAPADG